jgi:hypothetical protein
MVLNEQTTIDAEVLFAGVTHPRRDTLYQANGPVDLAIFDARGECVQRYSGLAAHALQRDGLVTRIAGIDRRPPAAGDLPFNDSLVHGDPYYAVRWLEAKGYPYSDT